MMICNLINEIFKEFEVTPKQVARYCGISETDLVLMSRGAINITRELLAQLLRLVLELKKNPSYFEETLFKHLSDYTISQD